MPLIAQVVLSWSIFAFLWGVICCKMTRLAVYNECNNREMRRYLSGLPGFWPPEHILLRLVFPAGGVLSFAIFCTCRLSGVL